VSPPPSLSCKYIDRLTSGSAAEHAKATSFEDSALRVAGDRSLDHMQSHLNTCKENKKQEVEYHHDYPFVRNLICDGKVATMEKR
jgi:hypothetical protein